MDDWLEWDASRHTVAAIFHNSSHLPNKLSWMCLHKTNRWYTHTHTPDIGFACCCYSKQDRIGMVELCTKILQIMHTVSEDYALVFTNYAHYSTVFVYFPDFWIKISTCKLMENVIILQKSNKNQHARITNVMQQFWLPGIQIPIWKLVPGNDYDIWFGLQREFVYAKVPLTHEMNYAEFVWLCGVWKIVHNITNYACTWSHNSTIPSLVVLETAVLVSRLLETEILRSWSRSWSTDLGCFWDRSIINIY